MSAENKSPEPQAGSRPGPNTLPSAAALLFGLLLAAAIVVPLLFSPWQHNAFELPKAMAVRMLAGLAMLFLFYLLVGGRLKKWWSDPLVVLLLLLAAALIAATIFGLDPALSLWGSYDRQFGLLTWLAPLALFGAALAVLQAQDRQRRLLQVLVWSSAPIVLYAALQALGADPFAWDSDGASAVLGTLGRSNFLGAYLVLIIPLTGASLLLAARRWPLAMLLVGQLVILGLSRARAAWLGLLAATLAFGLSWLVITGRRSLAGKLALVLLLLLVLLVALALILDVPATLTEGGSTAARLTIWKATLPLLVARPLLGYGPDAMELAFQGVFPPELVYYQGRHLAVDRAHNLWLDVGMSAGLLGLAAFILLLAFAGRFMWRGLNQAKDRSQQLMLVGAAAAVTGHLVELQVSFETVGTAVVFWLVLTLGVACARPTRSPADESAASTSWRPGKSLPLALAFIVLLGVLAVRPLQADGAYRQGLQRNPASAEALRYFVRAKRLWPTEPLYQVALAQAYWAGSQPAAAVSEAVSSAQQRPADARLWAAAGDLLARWAAVVPAHATEALAAYRRAIDLSPNTAAYHTALGLVLAQNGQLSGGIAAIERAVELDATDAIAYGHLAELYEAAGQPEQARWAAEQAEHWSGAAAGP